jgi:hypothetical protein
MGGISAGGIQPTDVRRALANSRRGVTLDNTGDVLMYEDWSNGFGGWILTIGTGGATIDLSLAQRLLGGGSEFSARMVSGTTGSAGDVRLTLNNTFVQLSPFGAEIAFLHDNNTSFVDTNLIVGTGTIQYQFVIRASISAGQLQYQDAGGVFQNFFAQSLLNAAANMFQRLKFVVDPRTGVYDRVIFNSRQIASIAGIAARTIADATPAYIRVLIHTGSGGGVSSTVYIGRAVATINEVL